MLDGATIMRFAEHWHRASDRAFAWPVWDAAYLLLGWIGDDSFSDVQAWLISHGQATFERVVAEPDNLVELAWDQENAFVESYGGLIHKAHVAVTGEPPVWPPGTGACAGDPGFGLEKYAAYGPSELSPSALQVAPFTQYGTVIELAERFNGGDKLHQALDDLGTRLFSVAA